MKHMKKTAAILLALVLVMALAACTSPATQTPDTPAGDPAVNDPTQAPEGGDTPIGGTELSVTWPEGFTVVSESPLLMAAGDGSSINLVETALDAQFDSYTKEDMEVALAPTFQTLGEGVEYTLDSFDKTTISGYSAITLTATIKATGITMSYTQLMINADKTYIITYTDMSPDGTHKSAFKNCIDSISFK